jgi:uncharacterized protein with HEPN domain
MKSDAVYLQHIVVALWDLTQTSLPGFKKQVASILKELA